MDMNKIRGLSAKLTQMKTTKEKEKTDKEKFQEAVQTIAARPEGVVFFRKLSRMCGFDMGSSLLKNGSIDPMSLVYNDARRSVYLELRKLIDEKDLINIEIKE